MRRVKLSVGAAGIASGIVWWLLTPLMATVGFCQGACANWNDKPWVIAVVGRHLAELGVFEAGEELYFGFGRLFVTIYLLVLVAFVAYHHLQRLGGGERVDRLRRSYRFLLVTMIVAALADFTSYGLGVFSEAAWRYGFMVEMLALLFVSAGMIWYGIVSRLTGIAPHWQGTLLSLAGLGVPVMMADRWFVMYVPNAALFPVCMAWLVIGIAILRARGTGKEPASARDPDLERETA